MQRQSNELSVESKSSRSRSRSVSKHDSNQRFSSQKTPGQPSMSRFLSQKSPSHSACSGRINSAKKSSTQVFSRTSTKPDAPARSLIFSNKKQDSFRCNSKQSNHVRFREYDGDLNGHITPSQRTQSKYKKFNASSSGKSKFQAMFSSPIKKKSTTRDNHIDSDTSLIDLGSEDDFGFESISNQESEDEYEEKKKVKTVRNLAKLNADSSTIFSKDESEMKNFVLSEKLSEREREVKETKLELDKLKKKNAELQEKSSALASIISELKA